MSARTKNCKIDAVSVSLKFLEDDISMSFAELLLHPDILNQEKFINYKSIHYSIIKHNEDYIIGFIRCILDKDLPAKIDKNTKAISQLDIKDNEGLAFGNIFLYSIKLNVLFYEINKNSIYLDSFRNFLYRCYTSSKLLKETPIDIHFNTIYRKKEYERALNMDIYKSFKMKVHQPKRLLQEILHINSSLEEKIDLDFLPEIKKAAGLNSDFAEIEFNVINPKKNGGLYKNQIEPIINNFKNILGFSQVRENIDIIEICGYTTDNSTSKTSIDLLGDVYCAKFNLSIPRLDSNLQITERRDLIIETFEREHAVLINYL